MFSTPSSLQEFLWFHSLRFFPPLVSAHFPCRHPSHLTLSSLLPFALVWLIYAITLSSSTRVLSLFWRLVNSRLMIYQILITACWKPHSLSWCMVMIVPVWLPELQQPTNSSLLFFLSLPSRLPFLCKLFSFCLCRLGPSLSNGLCIAAHIQALGAGERR